MTDYMTITTELPPYFFFPWFLMEMELTFTAKLAYALLLDRARLSQLNRWTDEAGRVYIIFPIEKIAEMLGKSMTTAKNVLLLRKKIGKIRVEKETGNSRGMML